MCKQRIVRPAVGSGFLKCGNGLAVFFRLVEVDGSAEFLNGLVVLALFERLQGPNSKHQKDQDHGTRQDYDAVSFVELKRLFGGGVKPIRLAKLLARYSSAGGRHRCLALAGGSQRQRDVNRKRNLPARYCLYLKSSGLIFSRISAHFSLETFETFSTAASFPSSFCCRTLEASRTALATEIGLLVRSA